MDDQIPRLSRSWLCSYTWKPGSLAVL